MAVINLNVDNETISNGFRLERMRMHRDRLLSASDWTQTPDNPIANKSEWATWRQQLRDFPASWTPADIVTFPKAPNE